MSPIPADVDVLLVAQPSSLTQKQIDNLTEYIRKGGPTLLFLDPLPVENPQISPEVPKQPPGGPFGGGQPPEPKGDLQPAARPARHRLADDRDRLERLQPAPAARRPAARDRLHRPGQRRAEDAFNEEQVATSGLQEIVMLFPGLLRPKAARAPSSPRLLRTNDTGGTIAWSEAAQQSFMGISGINPSRRHFPTRRRPTPWPPGSRARPRDRAREEGRREEEGRRRPGQEARAST